MRPALFALIVSLLLAACATAPAPAERPLTILISIDAFRTDYLDRGVTPTLSALAADGVRATMRPSFPSKTFPNHYTLVTGLRPDRSGMVENVMEDSAIPGVTFRMSDRAAVGDRRWWDEAEPIWVTAERAGVRTATMYWPGSEAPVRGVRPWQWFVFDQSVNSDARVGQVLKWLDLPTSERPRLITLYFDLVDTVGHEFGPDSAEVNAASAEVDAAMARLVAGLKARGIAANLVIGADHGMAPVSPDRRLIIEDIAPAGTYRVLAAGAFATLIPLPGREAELERAVLGKRPHLECWRKSEIPARFHYGKNPRVAPIFCLPETGWLISRRDFKPPKPERGAHGFDNFSPEMAAIFIAHGPAFRAGARPPAFDNVDVYPLLARLLGVRPAANDGDLDELGPTLVVDR